MMMWDGVPVERVRVHRMSDGGEVDPDLVRPPRLETHPEHRVPCGLREDLEMSNCGPPHSRGHERRVVRVPADRRVYGPCRGQPFPNHEGTVDAAHPPGRHHLYESRVSGLTFRQHQQARGVAVETVDDAGTVGVVAARYASIQERVHERTRRVASARVYNESGGFVHHQQMLVLEDYGHRDLLR